jgi:vacuolar-type H+-ATPase subunit F/Vma7
MTCVWYIGDEATAAAMRLAGAHGRTAPPGSEREALAAAREHAQLILLSTRVASKLPAQELMRAQLALAPLTLVVPDIGDDPAQSDRAGALRAQLGV